MAHHRFPASRGSFAVYLAVVLLALRFDIVADEGMYPLNEIARINLKAKGLKIDVREIYNPDGASLVDAICRVGGGTGEFVSADGLILTNHHIAFSAVAAASTPESDYLRNGFTATVRADEIPAKDYTCLITERYRDVSSEILSAVRGDMSPADRSKAIRDKRAELAAAEKAGKANITCEVAEMFPGKSYVLFTYREIRDVRLVYVPPRSIGEFGGENDNWMWPRHTGDFSFLRAYVAPDGSTAAYAKENVPFTPKRWLRVSPRGVRKEDFVMILGYPGRTYRHRTSHFLKMQEAFQLPYLSNIFDRMIATMEEAGSHDRSLQLNFADDIKGYANATKNYKGKLQGMRRLQLVQKRADEEAQLQAFIDQDPALRAKYGNVLSQIGDVYARYQTTILQELVARMYSMNRLVSIGMSILRNAERSGRTEATDSAFRAELEQRFAGIHLPTEKKFLQFLQSDAERLPDAQQFTHVFPAVESSVVSSMEKLRAAAVMPKEEALKSTDPVLTLARDVRKVIDEIQPRTRQREGELSRLEADLLDVKMLWKKSAFVPDANSTLRFTYGRVRGYAPSDATYYSPLTTLRGVIDKTRETEPYDTPQKLVGLYRLKNYNHAFEDPDLKDVPVCMLYNTDTSGGNSGSPVMNARGELVGVNFDRTFEATINDYQWSEEYSRSIAVDVRYVLFVAKYIGGADFLLKELGVKL